MRQFSSPKMEFWSLMGFWRFFSVVGSEVWKSNSPKRLNCSIKRAITHSTTLSYFAKLCIFLLCWTFSRSWESGCTLIFFTLTCSRGCAWSTVYYVNKRWKKEGRMLTLAPSVKYIYVKQWPLSPPFFTPAKAFLRKRICFFFYVFSPAEFLESLTTPGLFKVLQISLEGLNTGASWSGLAMNLQAVRKNFLRSFKLIDWLIT